MTKSAYIHIPFCKSKCFYCSFVSYNDLSLIDSYLMALCSQVKTEYKNESLDTVYIGGGTPSLLTTNQLKKIISLLSINDNAEFTVEVNPDSVDLTYLNELISLGANRISIGAQTFDDTTLKLIGRRHNSSQIISAVYSAKDAGFKNISLDLIYGLPNQSLDSFKYDLQKVLSLDVQHVSLYGLKIDSCSYFGQNPPQNLPDEDEQADMYLMAVNELTNARFRHYEISNFSRAGCESRHNLNYWNGSGYYGFGCSASGYVDSVRYTNESDIKKYIINPIKKSVQQNISEQEALEEAIFLGLRKIDGIDINEVNNKFNINFETKYKDVLNKYSNYFTKNDFNIALNIDGVMISNTILADFID